MRLTALLTTLTVILAPSFALAEGCNWGHDVNKSAASCADGKTWDPTAQACVDKATS